MVGIVCVEGMQVWSVVKGLKFLSFPKPMALWAGVWEPWRWLEHCGRGGSTVAGRAADSIKWTSAPLRPSVSSFVLQGGQMSC